MSKKIIAIIPARGGSKGIKKKNIKLLAGKPLLAYTAKAALESKLITRTILSTEDEEIAHIGKELGLEVPFKRPASLAKDNTPSLPVITHALEQLKKLESYIPNIIVILQPTSPLRTSKHIDEAINLFKKNNTDSLVSVTKVPHNMIPDSVMILNSNKTLTPFFKINENNTLRQKKPIYYARNGAAIYICTYNCLTKKQSLYGDSILSYLMAKNDSYDIDDMDDWNIVSKIMMGKI